MTILFARPFLPKHTYAMSFAFSLSACVLLMLMSFVNATAQDDPGLPPPPIVVSKEDNLRLEAKTNVKDRTKLALEMMDIHISAAERFGTDQNYARAYGEFGVFHGLLDNLVTFLERSDRGDTKNLDEFKRLDIALRRFGPRIETIRRDMPTEYDDYVRELLQRVRDVRSRAVDHFFDHSNGNYDL
jgi:hypothetical protein